MHGMFKDQTRFNYLYFDFSSLFFFQTLKRDTCEDQYVEIHQNTVFVAGPVIHSHKIYSGVRLTLLHLQAKGYSVI